MSILQPRPAASEGVGLALRRWRVLLSCCVLPLAMLGLSGCSKPKPNQVTGKVMLRGAPVPGGTVIFEEQGGKNTRTTSIIETDGSYRMVNIPPGTVKIGVVPPGKSSDPAKPNPKVDIPVKLQDPKKSGLEYTVVKGDQKYDIDLKP